jgi:membrane associated rhomboid family serine protease
VTANVEKKPSSVSGRAAWPLGLVCVAAFFVVMTLGLQLWPGASELLRFSRSRYDQGAAWQIWTSQWVHLSNWHAVGNAFAFSVIIVTSGVWIRWPFQMLALMGGYAVSTRRIDGYASHQLKAKHRCSGIQILRR